MTIKEVLELHRSGRVAQAETGCREILLVTPGDPEATHVLGMLLGEQGRMAEAVPLLRRSIEGAPSIAAYHHNLGGVLGRIGLHEEAVKSARTAVRLRPDWAEPFHNMGVALEHLGKLQEAVDAYARATSLLPNYPEAHNHCGNALRKLGRLDEAAACHRRAIELRPTYYEAFNNLAATYTRMGDQAQAIACHRKCVELAPRSSQAHSDLLVAMHYPADVPAESLFTEARLWEERNASPLYCAAQPHPNTPVPNRRLRVGYVSPDFREHPVARAIGPVLRQHDHSQFETFCYSDVNFPDSETTAIRIAAGRWNNIVGRDNEALARLIRDDGIDVLVDLAGHMAGGRLLTFARKPAPVQITHFGYPDTTGLAAIDYRITDGYSDPIGCTEKYHPERFLRLPECAWCYDPGKVPPIGPLPVLSAGTVTFGCLNNPIKVGPEVVETWSRILRVVPRSRLILLSGYRDGRDSYFLPLFRRHGISGDRLFFVASRPRQQYLELFNQIDIGLDPFPYNGGISSCDALWMGVPFVTLQGNDYRSRQGFMLLSNLGLASLAAPSVDKYVNAAVQLAGDIDKIDQIRQTLRDRVRRSPVGDTHRFTRHLECAYRAAWQEWCQGQPSR